MRSGNSMELKKHQILYMNIPARTPSLIQLFEFLMRFIKKNIEKKKRKVLYVHRTYHVCVCVCVKGLFSFSGSERIHICIMYATNYVYYGFVSCHDFFSLTSFPSKLYYVCCITQCCERHLPPHKTKPKQTKCVCVNAAGQMQLSIEQASQKKWYQNYGGYSRSTIEM